MIVHVKPEAGFIAVTVTGRFDAHGIDDFDRQVVDVIDAAHPHLGIDLSSVDFMDSSALAGLVRALKATVLYGGSMALVDVSDAVRIILELTRLDAVFTVASSMSDAARGALTAAGR